MKPKRIMLMVEIETIESLSEIRKANQITLNRLVPEQPLSGIGILGKIQERIIQIQANVVKKEQKK